jgi:hypothetical protein
MVERDEKWQTNSYNRLSSRDSQPDRLLAEDEPDSGHEARDVGVSKSGCLFPRSWERRMPVAGEWPDRRVARRDYIHAARCVRKKMGELGQRPGRGELARFTSRLQGRKATMHDSSCREGRRFESRKLRTRSS